MRTLTLILALVFAGTACNDTNDSTTGQPLEEDPPYDLEADLASFSDICGTGDEITWNATGTWAEDDEGWSDDEVMDFSIAILGTTSDIFQINTNGMIAFEDPGLIETYTNVSIPDAAAPDAIVAPLWDDLYIVSACVLHETTKTTVQWEGLLYNSLLDVEMQLIMHDDDVIEFVYGANHDLTSDDATVGIENAAGDEGFLMSFNELGFGIPSTSWTMTPAAP